MDTNNLKTKFIKINEDLITEGNEVVNTNWESGALGGITRVDTESVYSWVGKIESFSYQLGTAARPWKEILNSNDP